MQTHSGIRRPHSLGVASAEDRVPVYSALAPFMVFVAFSLKCVHPLSPTKVIVFTATIAFRILEYHVECGRSFEARLLEALPAAGFVSAARGVTALKSTAAARISPKPTTII